MTRIRLMVAALLTVAAVGVPVAAAQLEVRIDQDRWGRPVFRIGQDYVLRAGSEVDDAVVVFGDATIEGHVDTDVIVVLGKAQIASTAVIDGNLVVVGGHVVIASGAQVGRDLVVVAGGYDAPPGFSPGGQHVVIGGSVFGGRLEALVPWITRGLLWGRLIVPDLPWIWTIVAVVFLVYLALGLIFHEPVRACTETLAAKPLTTFAVGLLVLLLTGPVCLLLAVSVVGLAVVPFVLAALFIGGIMGKIAVARWIGASVMPQESHQSRPQSNRSFIIGFAVLCFAYMIPVLGFVAWTLVGVLGLGAAALAFISAYRRENPIPPPRRSGIPAPPTSPPPVSSPPVPSPAMSSPAMSFEETSPPPMSTPAQHVEAAAASDEPPSIAFTPPPVSRSGPPATADLASFPHAAFGERLAAFVLDVILVVIVTNVLDLSRHDHDSAFFVLLLAYHIGFWTWKATTVGGIICQLRVVRVDGTPLNFADALVRGLSSIFSLAVFGLGGLWILRDPERQAWHDRIAGTYVVKVPRNWPL
jgi:uncharacterized RDD family membrane protein YckC